MSLNSVMSAALSGLQTAQTGLTTVSNNITNVNTLRLRPRDRRTGAPAVTGAVGDGVTVDDVKRVTNQYLEAANHQATSAAGSSAIISNLLLDQAQAAFGDSSQAGSISTSSAPYSATSPPQLTTRPQTCRAPRRWTTSARSWIPLTPSQGP